MTASLNKTQKLVTVN